MMEGERQFHFGIGKQSRNEHFQFESNFIKTSQYNIVTFVPISLALQFKQYANIYFLVIAILQCIPIIATQEPISAIAPLVFVISLSMIREALEDYTRFQSDQELNKSTCKIFSNGQLLEREWIDVKVGDLLLVEDNEMISADMVVLYSSIQSGQCFIQTSSLDGEKNLKPQTSVNEYQSELRKALVKFDPEKLLNIQIDQREIQGRVTCSPPNSLLNSYQACLYVNGDESQQIPVNHKNLVLRGSRLKNVEFILGLVTYTGKDTKVMKNADPPKVQQTKIENLTNVYIILIFVIQLSLCIWVSVINAISCKTTNNLTYDLKLGTDCNQQFSLTFLSYFLLLNTMIPISLIVSLEFVKLGQGFLMEKDLDLYTQHNDKPLKVFTCQLNEELGQIQYIFTDKTGTLTCNKMEFKMLVSGNQIYGDMNSMDDDFPFKDELEENKEEEVKLDQYERQNKSKDNNFLNILKQNVQKDQSARESTHSNGGTSRISVTTRVRQPSYVDQRSGIEYCFDDAKLDTLFQGHESQNDVINFRLFASSVQDESEGKPIQTYMTQRDITYQNILLLASCHQCVLQKEKGTTQFIYQGPSPDEIALVDAARHMGFKFIGNHMKYQQIDVFGKEESLELLNMFEFDSDRQRMTVIVRHNGKIKMMCKGADSIVISRLRPGNQPFLESTKQKLEYFSKKGLRTLCLAIQYISEAEYQEFAKKISSVINDPNRQEAIKQIAETMERDLYLIGATAVEDRLQDSVPETLRDFLKAQINVWMLTGDQLETAENIGKSCNMITSQMTVLYIKTQDSPIEAQLQELENQIQSLSQDMGIGLIVQGEALALILSETDRISSFLRIIIRCKSVICCRVTPKQKADVVRLVKQNLNKITLSVGDGANDVNMIQEAHIGVGIYGNEGMRAVQASNYAIGEFQCLWKLILYHGRLNYIRIAECILYFFYKNMVFTLPQLYFAFYCLTSGQSVFDDWYITLFNCLFTFWPVVIRAVFDQDVYYSQKKDSAEQSSVLKENYPLLYYVGQKNKQFRNIRFFKWLFLGFFQGGICFYIQIFALSKDTILDESGMTPDIWIMSISLYTSIIILVNLKLALNTQFWNGLTWIAFFLTSIGSYFAYVWISDSIPKVKVYQTASTLFTSDLFYFTVSLSVLSMFALDLMFFSFKISKNNLTNYFKRIYRQQEEADESKIKLLEAEISDADSIELQNNIEKANKKQSQKNDRTEQTQQIVTNLNQINEVSASAEIRESLLEQNM